MLRHLAIVLLVVFFRVDVHAQERAYTLALREVALADALERFVDATGLAVSYEPALVRGRTASCAAEAESAETVLRCILRTSGLDFYRLSSGTYVIAKRVEVAPQRGFLAGRVTDLESGTPLEGAHVMLADAGMGAVTDPSGRFTFPGLLPGPYVVRVSHLGYRSWSDSLVVQPLEQIRTEAALRPEPLLITPVVVDGMAHRPPFHAVDPPAVEPSDQFVPPQATYRRLPALAGVRLNDVTADAHIQGGDPGAHQLRLDGAPVFLPWTLGGMIGPFGSLALDRITIYRAGFAAAQGSQIGGVLDAEHALALTSDLDVQADPYSLNGRVRLAPDLGESRSLSALLAVRRGLWDVLTPSTLQSTLDDWSRPDAFLLFGPLTTPGRQFDAEPPLLSSPTHPEIHYSDLHGAARLRLGPLRSLHASFYDGRQRLDGGVFPGQTSEGLGRVDFTVLDDYAWSNRLGQVRYDAVLGSRTLASLQLRASRYRLTNDYETIDSLRAALEGGTVQLAAVSTTPVRDQNFVSIVAIEGTVDHALAGHHLRAALESGLIESRFELQSVFFRNSTGGDYVDLPSGWLAESQNAGRVENVADAWYVAAYGQDRVRLSSSVDAELGVRLTYLQSRQTVYAEPRLAVLYRGPLSGGTWTARTSTGLYRQFLNQTDASKLNAGSLLPSVRVWLPVDASVRPPLAYHAAQDVVLQPSESWTVRMDAYLKHEPHGLALAYAQADSLRFLTGRVEQSEFLYDSRESSAGGSASIEWQGSSLRAEVRYGQEYTRRSSEALFAGRKHPSPWAEPHRLEFAADWQPFEAWTFSARWKGIWQRAWGFRRMYYDYFGHSAATRHLTEFDLGRPGDHVLPPLYQLDLGAAYTQHLGTARIQIRADIINAFDRRNVLDWRLVPDADSGGWKKEARHLYPMMPSLAVRVGF